ncbi:MAG: hypothetical protein RBR02_07845 [Desulfuromonadaceae bacterium]|nr:hypothetical protein [Desulfuromonadaceae bacterium]
MHDGCSGSFSSGADIVRKLRAMGFNTQTVPTQLHITCEGCNSAFTMETFESTCPECGLIYGVTPCHAHDPAAVLCAGPKV